LVRGTLEPVDERRIVISSENAPVEVMRSRVKRVTVFTGLTRGTRAKRGFLVGAAAGALVAALTVERNRGPWMFMLSAGWGALGALFSALDGSNRTATVIYEDSGPEALEMREALVNQRLHPAAAVSGRHRASQLLAISDAVYDRGVQRVRIRLRPPMCRRSRGRNSCSLRSSATSLASTGRHYIGLQSTAAGGILPARLKPRARPVHVEGA
jgi:hypothetical protein